MGSWELERYKVGNLLTNNQSKSFNATVKRYIKSKNLGGLPLDTMVVSLFQLDQFFLEELLMPSMEL